MNIEKNILKKMIKYRLSYSGTKETDILYQRLILNKLDYLNDKELISLSNLFNEISDVDIFNMLTRKITKIKKYEKLIDKIINE